MIYKKFLGFLLLIFSIFNISLPQTFASNLREADFEIQNIDLLSKFTINYQNDSFTYKELYDGYLDDPEMVNVVLEEIKNIIYEIEQLSENALPDKRLEKNELQKKLGPLVHFLGCCGQVTQLEKIYDDLRSIYYPIDRDDIENWNYRYFDKPVENDDLLLIIQQYPNSLYEKKALKKIIFESSVVYWTAGRGFPRLKILIQILQASKLFLQKYPQDTDAEKVKAVYQKAQEIYNISDEEDYFDESYENSRIYYIYDIEGKVTDFDNLPFKIRKKPLEEVLSDSLGHVTLIETIFKDLGTTAKIYPIIEKAYAQGWLEGYPDGTVRLLAKINRAEFAKMVIKAFEKEEISIPSNINKIFPDVTVNAWYAKTLYTAMKSGLITGYPDGTAKPERTINKVEALKMVLELLKANYQTTQPQFKDTLLNQWYSKYTSFAYENGLGSIDEMGNYNPSQELTRGEAIELISKVLALRELEASIATNTPVTLNETKLLPVGKALKKSIIRFTISNIQL